MSDSNNPKPKPSKLAETLARALALNEKNWSWDWSYNPSLKEHMHALGVIAANYNKLESTFALLLYTFMGNEMSKGAQFLFQKLSNHERLELLTQLYSGQVKDSNLIDRLDWFVSGFGKCAENRNILMHSEPHNHANALMTISSLDLRKWSKSGALNFVSVDLAELRQIADDIDRFDTYAFGLVLFVIAQRNGGKIILSAGEETPSLPDRPPEPALLRLSSQKPAKNG